MSVHLNLPVNKNKFEFQKYDLCIRGGRKLDYKFKRQSISYTQFMAGDQDY